MFNTTHIEILGLIENMAHHTCSNCGHEEAIFCEGGAKILSEEFNIPYLGQLPLNRHIAYDCEQGIATVSNESNPLSPCS